LIDVLRGAFRIVAFCGAILLIIFILSFMNISFKMGVDDILMVNTIYLLFFVLMFFIFNKKVRAEFLKVFIRKEAINGVVIAALVTMFLEIIINMIRFIPYIFGHDVLGPGKGQYVPDDALTEFGVILYIGIITGFTEEFIFRFLGYSGLGIVLYKIVDLVVTKSIDKKTSRVSLMIATICENIHDKLFVQKSKKYLFYWLMIISFLFAMVHLPSVLSFPLYFIPGLFFGFLFLRYGFLAAWIAHALGNIYSPLALDISISILKMLGVE
jgi:membrane protease YdiL (CAAX protease family)